MGDLPRVRQFAAGLAWLALIGCQKSVEVAPPPRVVTKAELPEQLSTIAAPVTVQIADIQAALNRAAPRRLWQIDQHEEACVPAQHILKGKILGVKVFGRKGLKVTPDLGCQIVGSAVRGPIRLTGRGRTLLMTMPVSAVVTVRDVGGIIRHETATGAAAVSATVRLGMRPDWTPTATIKITYDWTNPPGIDLLGRRITFIKQADARLAKVIAGLEKSLPAELGKLNVRSQVADIWRSGFTTILLNRENPQAWMRVTPQKLGMAGYNAGKREVMIDVAAELLTETFIGDRPVDPKPTPLPPASAELKETSLVFNTAVIADYAEIEPVLLRALQKRATKGFTVKDLGPVEASFQKVAAYATENGRIALGVDLTAEMQGQPGTKTSATVWLTGKLFNAPNSPVLSVRDLAIDGDTNNGAANLAIRLLIEPTMIETLQTAITEDFSKVFARVIAAAQKAIAQRRQGDIIVEAEINDVRSGQIAAIGQGLMLPVRATGRATFQYMPRR